MKPTALRIAFVVFIALAWAACVSIGFPGGGPRPEGQPTPVPEGEEWVDLLAQTQAGSWKNITDERDIFELSEGELHIFGQTLPPLRYVAYTGEPLGDFDLHLEYRLRPGANSGVFLRVIEDDPVRRGFEVQVLDDHGHPPTVHTSGAIYDVVSPMFNLSRPAGSWNSLDISLRGTHVLVVMNGWKVVDTDFSTMTQPIGKFSVPYAELPLEGLLALQDHGGEVWYRNIRLRQLR